MSTRPKRHPDVNNDGFLSNIELAAFQGGDSMMQQSNGGMFQSPGALPVQVMGSNMGGDMNAYNQNAIAQNQMNQAMRMMQLQQRQGRTSGRMPIIVMQENGTSYWNLDKRNPDNHISFWYNLIDFVMFFKRKPGWAAVYCLAILGATMAIPMILGTAVNGGVQVQYNGVRGMTSSDAPDWRVIDASVE